MKGFVKAIIWVLVVVLVLFLTLFISARIAGFSSIGSMVSFLLGGGAAALLKLQ